MASKVGVAQIAARSGRSEDDVRAVFTALSSYVEEGVEVVVEGFGRFTLRTYGSRDVYLPHRGENVRLEARERVTFQDARGEG